VLKTIGRDIIDNAERRMTTVTKVNLGSGADCLDDWINIDHSFNARLAKHPRLRHLLFRIGILPKRFYEISWPKDIMIHDLRKKLPLNDNSVDFIYSSHFIEHLNKDEAEKLSRECLRVLKKGGIIRLSVPDLELIARDYLEELSDSKTERTEGHLPSEKFLEALDFKREKMPLYLIMLSPGQHHRWMYDRISLTRLLRQCGFANIERKSYREGRVPDIDSLDNRPEHSLYLEATKP
jgi:predicted SAM-dependent methyltransferase